jgi:hypothetical protein
MVTRVLNTNLLNPEVAVVLASKGWHPNRRVSTSETLARCRAAGFVANAPAIALLKNLLDLRLENNGRWIDFRPEQVIAVLNRDDVRLIEGSSGQGLFPLGVASGNYLFVGDTGRVLFLDFDWMFYVLFHDTVSAINSLLSGDQSGIILSKQLGTEERPVDFR